MLYWSVCGWAWVWVWVPPPGACALRPQGYVCLRSRLPAGPGPSLPQLQSTRTCATAAAIPCLPPTTTNSNYYQPGEQPPPESPPGPHVPFQSLSPTGPHPTQLLGNKAPEFSDLPQYQGSGRSVSTMACVREGSQEGLNEPGAPTQPRVRGGDPPPISPG